MTQKDKFLSLVSPANKETLDNIRFREENKAWLSESKRIAVKVLQSLKRQGMSQKDLAAKMGVTPQYINKLVKGKENFTLDTLLKLQGILDIPLLASYSESKYSKKVEIFQRIEAYTELKSGYCPFKAVMGGYE